MFKVPEKYRLTTGPMATTRDHGNNGAFVVPYPRGTAPLCCVASDGAGWEHVSVSLPNRCPTWPEMDYIKTLFWEEDDTVYQIHPPAGEKVDNHPYCLHLWRPVQGPMSLPPRFLVGVR